MKKIRYFIPAICMMLLIFYMSHQPGNDSMQTSNFFVDFIRNVFSLSNEYVDILSTIIRKGAHMSEYALLAILLFYGFYHLLYVKYTYLVTLLVTFIYACSDEFHQLFIAGRSGQFTDVLVDTSGAIIGLIILYFGIFIWKKQYRRTKGE